MDEKTPGELEAERHAFRAAALKMMSNLKPTMEGIANELKRQQRQTHDHEDFLVHEFRDFTRAVDSLTAQLARM